MSNETRAQPCVNPSLLTQSIHPSLYPLQQSLCEYSSPISRVYTRSGFEIVRSTTITPLLTATHSSFICAEQTANQQKKDKSILFVCLKWTKNNGNSFPLSSSSSLLRSFHPLAQGVIRSRVPSRSNRSNHNELCEHGQSYTAVGSAIRIPEGHKQGATGRSRE